MVLYKQPEKGTFCITHGGRTDHRKHNIKVVWFKRGIPADQLTESTAEFATSQWIVSPLICAMTGKILKEWICSLLGFSSNILYP
jgi:hypothetical protein